MRLTILAILASLIAAQAFAQQQNCTTTCHWIYGNQQVCFTSCN